MVKWSLTRKTQIHRANDGLFVVFIEQDRNCNQGNENGNKIDVGLAHTNHHNQN